MTADKMNEPIIPPITVNTAALRPHAIARAIMKRTVGPGAKIMMMEVTTNSQMREGMGIWEFYVNVA